jgi:hypothetical protein
MIKRRAVFLAPLAIAAAALPGIWAASASAAGTSNGGLVHLYQVDTTTGPQAGSPAQVASDGVTLTGALADYGVDWEAPGTSNINVLALHNGDIALDISKWGVGNQPPPTEYPNNCSFTSVVVGPVRVVQNKLPFKYAPGMYANLHGTFYVKATFAGVVPPLNGGNGCDFSQIGSTQRGLDFVEATGVVHFSR